MARSNGNVAVIASHRASKDARPDGRAMADGLFAAPRRVCQITAAAPCRRPNARAAMRVRRLHHRERGDQPADAGDRRQAPGGDEAKLGPMTADRVHELRALARNASAAGLPPRTAPPRRPHRSCRAPHRAWRAGARSTAPRARAASIHGPNDAPPRTPPSPPPSPAASRRRAAPGRASTGGAAPPVRSQSTP